MLRKMIAAGSVAAAAILLAAPALADSGPCATVTFNVGGQTYRVQLTNQADIDHANALLAGTATDRKLPIGDVIRGTNDINSPHPWSIDPASFKFTDMATEVCDGLPSDVDKSDWKPRNYCPWHSQVIDVSS